LAAMCNLCEPASPPKAGTRPLAQKTRSFHAGACHFARSLDREGEPVQGEQTPRLRGVFFVLYFAFFCCISLWITLWITCG